MYEQYVNNRAPLAFFMLDDTTPFQEYSGSSWTAQLVSGDATPTTSVPLVSGAAFSTVFKNGSQGRFDFPLYQPGRESQPWVMEAWVLPIQKGTAPATGDQRILSHSGQYDGLSINGRVIRFGTEYLTFGTAYCDYDLQSYQLAHVVGIHKPDRNELWVNGELVSYIDITDDQRADTFNITSPSPQYVYSGGTGSTQELSVNAVAFYASLSGDQIRQNYAAGIDFIGQNSVYTQFGGTPFYLTSAVGSVYIDEVWADKSDFQRGRKVNVEYAPDQIEPAYSGGVSVAGTWTTSVSLDLQGDTSIYGVALDWSGRFITVETSLNGGSTWQTATAGRLISSITSGYNPTGKDLQIRVSFAGGLAADPAFLESLRVTAYRNNSVLNTSSRAVTLTYPAVPRENHEPNLYKNRNGVYLNGGTLTIGTDTTGEPDAARTLEMWIKPISGTVTVSVGGTVYRNGVADTTLPIGEWSLVHYVRAADIVGTITVSGDCIVGQATIYPTTFTATNIANIWKSYTGSQVIRIVDGDTLTVSEPAVPSSIYAQDWSISAGG
jgi:hypothetical protein